MKIIVTEDTTIEPEDAGEVVICPVLKDKRIWIDMFNGGDFGNSQEAMTTEEVQEFVEKLKEALRVMGVQVS